MMREVIYGGHRERTKKATRFHAGTSRVRLLLRADGHMERFVECTGEAFRSADMVGKWST